ncbi:hypothetical protein SIID45300_02387 [Candidatus Magnetaquicoccaceae bacterium FCR-1]|uniref:Uncharacterized protein n=1 Tax=Candidatus Magnetaquiglobus chichijimensis TaxID=3141448 RepID=A0ABQ0CAY3_9PROT
MSAIYPVLPRPKSVQIGSVTPSIASETHSLRVQTRSRNVHRWTFKLTYMDLTRDEHATLRAFCLAQRGRLRRFLFTPPIHAAPRGVILGSPKVHGSAFTRDPLDGVMRVVTKGWIPSVSGIVKAFDFIQFNGHSKVYAAIEDASSDGSGHATLIIEPGLLYPVADDESVIVSDVPFVCSVAEDGFADRLIGGPWYQDVEINLVERL